MRLSVYLSTKAEKFLSRVYQKDQKLYALFKAHLDKLPHEYQTDPFLKGSGYEKMRKHRVGDYRILYQVVRERLMIYVVQMGHRRDIYDR